MAPAATHRCVSHSRTPRRGLGRAVGHGMADRAGGGDLQRRAPDHQHDERGDQHRQRAVAPGPQHPREDHGEDQRQHVHDAHGHGHAGGAAGVARRPAPGRPGGGRWGARRRPPSAPGSRRQRTRGDSVRRDENRRRRARPDGSGGVGAAPATWHRALCLLAPAGAGGRPSRARLGGRAARRGAGAGAVGDRGPAPAGAPAPGRPGRGHAGPPAAGPRCCRTRTCSGCRRRCRSRSGPARRYVLTVHDLSTELRPGDLSALPAAVEPADAGAPPGPAGRRGPRGLRGHPP